MSAELFDYHGAYRDEFIASWSTGGDEIFDMIIGQGRNFHHWDDNVNSIHTPNGRKRIKTNSAKVGGNTQDDGWDAFLIFMYYAREFLGATHGFEAQYRQFIAEYHPKN